MDLGLDLHIQVHGFGLGPYIYRCIDLGLDLHIQVHGFRRRHTYTGAWI